MTTILIPEDVIANRWGVILYVALLQADRPRGGAQQTIIPRWMNNLGAWEEDFDEEFRANTRAQVRTDRVYDNQTFLSLQRLVGAGHAFGPVPHWNAVSRDYTQWPEVMAVHDASVPKGSPQEAQVSAALIEDRRAYQMCRHLNSVNRPDILCLTVPMMFPAGTLQPLAGNVDDPEQAHARYDQILSRALQLGAQMLKPGGYVLLDFNSQKDHARHARDYLLQSELSGNIQRVISIVQAYPAPHRAEPRVPGRDQFLMASFMIMQLSEEGTGGEGGGGAEGAAAAASSGSAPSLFRRVERLPGPTQEHALQAYNGQYQQGTTRALDVALLQQGVPAPYYEDREIQIGGRLEHIGQGAAVQGLVIQALQSEILFAYPSGQFVQGEGGYQIAGPMNMYAWTQHGIPPLHQIEHIAHQNGMGPEDFQSRGAGRSPLVTYRAAMQILLSANGRHENVMNVANQPWIQPGMPPEFALRENFLILELHPLLPTQSPEYNPLILAMLGINNTYESLHYYGWRHLPTDLAWNHRVVEPARAALLQDVQLYQRLIQNTAMIEYGGGYQAPAPRAPPPPPAPIMGVVNDAALEEALALSAAEADAADAEMQEALELSMLQGGMRGGLEWYASIEGGEPEASPQGVVVEEAPISLEEVYSEEAAQPDPISWEALVETAQEQLEEQYNDGMPFNEQPPWPWSNHMDWFDYYHVEIVPLAQHLAQQMQGGV